MPTQMEIDRQMADDAAEILKAFDSLPVGRAVGTLAVALAGVLRTTPTEYLDDTIRYFMDFVKFSFANLEHIYGPPRNDDPQLPLDS
jgi:exoribonuclease II